MCIPFLVNSIVVVIGIVTQESGIAECAEKVSLSVADHGSSGLRFHCFQKISHGERVVCKAVIHALWHD